MTKLTIRQKKSLYNHQKIRHIITQCTNSNFKMKRKGKRCFYITFENPIDTFSINKIAKKLGLQISYKSNVRCIISDDYNISIC